MARLSKGKAAGIDGLNDNMLHSISQIGIKKELTGLKFIAEKIEEILNSVMWPSYLGTARFIPLSKINSPFPKADQIRTIAVLPAWSKIIELSILQKLNPHMYGMFGAIDKAQAGFKPGAGTEIQVNRLLQVFD